MEPILRLSSIEKKHGARTALHLDSLVIRQGGFYLLTGPNGSGKSTLLSIMALLSRPDCGEVYLQGERVRWTEQALCRLRKRVTLLHQSPYLFSGTVFDNVAFGMKRHGFHHGELHDRAEQALAVGLADFQQRSATALSGGEARRVALARALAVEPALLLLDEPLANVDRQSAARIEALIGTLPSRGTTVIFSSHDPHQSCNLCERIALVDGMLEEPYTLLKNEWKEPSYACL